MMRTPLKMTAAAAVVAAGLLGTIGIAAAQSDDPAADDPAVESTESNETGSDATDAETPTDSDSDSDSEPGARSSSEEESPRSRQGRRGGEDCQGEDEADAPAGSTSREDASVDGATA
jgi:hypothetical protein